MSRRPPPPELDPVLPAVPDPAERPDEPDCDPELELEDPVLSDPAPAPEPEDPLVEYFVDVLELFSERTSVPKSAQLSQTSSSAPSTFTVFGEPVFAPHISHWTILRFDHAPA